MMTTEYMTLSGDMEYVARDRGIPTVRLTPPMKSSRLSQPTAGWTAA